MSRINFDVKPFKIGNLTIIQLPRDVSAKLPSRGMALISGTLNGSPFKAVLEPDGKGSHWLKADKTLPAFKSGETVKMSVEPSKDWPEPEVPADLTKAIKASAKASDMWAMITPMARWDWLRWIRSTKNPETYKKHIEVAISKMEHGERRPCCFNRNVCTVMEVSKNGALLDPA